MLLPNHLLAAVFCPTTKKRQMIKANEIRVGNFINEKVLGNVKILEIHTKVVIVEAINLTVNKEKIAQQYTLSLNHIEPIEVTDYDILLKFGFETKIDDMYLIFGNLFFVKFNDDEYVHLNDVKCNTIYSYKYLHELQNVYFSLTGQELSVVANGS